MKYILVALLAWPFILSGQNDLPAIDLSKAGKGITPLPAEALAKAGTTTRAVVVGISDYQDKDIPDLRFADKDAEAFVNFLRSPAGGALDGDHLKLLTNQNATLGQLTAAFDWLLEVTKEGEEAVIYFSGHGDQKTLPAQLPARLGRPCEELPGGRGPQRPGLPGHRLHPLGHEQGQGGGHH